MVEDGGEERVRANRPNIFISYASQDAALANAVVGVLERAGLECWIAPRNVVPGALYAGEIVRAINESSLFVLVLSAHSVTSTHVGKELERASSKRRRIIALRTDATELPDAFEYFLSESQWIEVGSGGIDPAAAKLAEAVRRHLGDGSGSPSGGGATLAHTSSSEARKRPPRGVLWGVTAVLFVGLAAAAAWKLHLGTAITAATPTSETSSSPRTSVAVMPFANLTGDASKEYLGDGMGEELIDALAKVPGLKIPSRTSSFAYKGRHVDLKQIASDLHVGTILEGSVRSAGETIRISAELIDAQTDTHLWSDTYDRKFTDLFKLQDDLAQAIVQALKANLSGVSAASLTKPQPTRNVKAYDLYLQSSAVLSPGTQHALDNGMALLKRALDIDPEFAAALAELAEVRLGHVVLGYPLPNALADAERDATRALELDPGLATAQQALGTLNAFRGNWVEADARFKLALSDDPRNADGNIDYVTYVLTSVGQMQLALDQSQKAYRLAPAFPRASVILATTYSIMGRDSEALKYIDIGAKLMGETNVPPVPQIYANAHSRSGNHAEAADRIIPTLPAGIRAAGGEAVIRDVYTALGEPAKKQAASDALQNLVRKLKPNDLPVNTRKDLLALFTQLGALDRAFTLANQSLDLYAREGTVGTAWGALWIPEMRPFRQDPRFQAFVTRLNLIAYWKVFGPPDGCDLKEDKLNCF